MLSNVMKLGRGSLNGSSISKMVFGAIGIGMGVEYLHQNPTFSESNNRFDRLTGHYSNISATKIDPGAPQAAPLTQDVYIESLGLIPHPEGGFFRETYRSGAVPMKSRGQTDEEGALMPTEREPGLVRNVMTSIYWLLNKDSPNGWWCCNLSDHVHYYHAGVGITYYVLKQDGSFQTQRLGPNVDNGDVLQFEVKGGDWKACHVGDDIDALKETDFTLIGEAVGPGFDFRDFRWVTEADLEERLSPETFQKVCKFVKPDQRRDFSKYYDADKQQNAE